MKLNVLRHLLTPWSVFFVLTLVIQVFLGIKFQIDLRYNSNFHYFIIAGILVCAYLNFKTTTKAGIWIAHAVPKYLRPNSTIWLQLVVLSILVVGIFIWVGNLYWIPLFWDGFIVPAVTSFAILFIIRSLVGPILQWSSMISFTRLAVFIMTLPIFLLIPITAIVIGHHVLKAYEASQPLPTIIVSSTGNSQQIKIGKHLSTEDDSELFADPKSEKAMELKEIFESKKAYCPENTKEILSALSPESKDEVLFWGLKSIKCGNLKSIVALTKLIDIAGKNAHPKIRAAAIDAMNNFPREDIRRIGYVIIKKINERESPEVIFAAARVLATLGENEYKWTLRRLKELLNHPKLYEIAAKALVEIVKKDDFIISFINENISGGSEQRTQAIKMICLLPEKSRIEIDPLIESIVSNIKSGNPLDPAMNALDCLGDKGIETMRQEVSKTIHLEKSLAAQALSEMNIQNSIVALETISQCVHDRDENVRIWCSQGLGKIGAPALPKIVDLLKSTSKEKVNAGEQALHFFADKTAKEELLKIRYENSGWTATQRKLQIAKAIDAALNKIQQEESAVK